MNSVMFYLYVQAKEVMLAETVQAINRHKLERGSNDFRFTACFDKNFADAAEERIPFNILLYYCRKGQRCSSNNQLQIDFEDEELQELQMKLEAKRKGLDYEMIFHL